MNNGNNNIIGTLFWALVSIILTPAAHANSNKAVDATPISGFGPAHETGFDGEPVLAGDYRSMTPAKGSSANIWS